MNHSLPHLIKHISHHTSLVATVRMPSRASQTAREFRDLDEGSQADSGEEDDSLGPLASPSRSGSRKRKRLSQMQLDEIFENMDPEEKARIAKEYRLLQVEADGTPTEHWHGGRFCD